MNDKNLDNNLFSQNSESAPNSSDNSPPSETAPQTVIPPHNFEPSPNYESASHERVYIGVQSNMESDRQTKKTKKPEKKGFGIGAAALVVILCVALSGISAFVGTYAANSLLKSLDKSPLITNKNDATPSVIFKSYENPNENTGTYEQVSEAVSPTVVEITTESISTDSLFWGNYVTSGAGSGVIISSDGIIVTNNHVVSGASSIKVSLSDGTEYPAKVIGTDSDTDIAVIKIEAADLPFALLGDSDTITVGQEVLAVGNPLGELGGTVTNGIISALSREVSISGSVMTLIQTNAEVNPGNSGGGLFNMRGELIGVVNAKSTSTSSGISVEGIGFAIPSNTVAKVTDELINHGYVRGKAILGINYEDITSSYEAMIYRVSALGVYVTASAQPDKLMEWDRIVAIDGEDVFYSDDVKKLLTGRSVGDVVTVTVVRGGRHVNVDVPLIEKKPTSAAEDDQENEDVFENNFRDWIMP